MQKDEFLYTVTHELRTPLTSIRALAEILADNPDLEVEERQRFQHTIGREAERLTRLITLVLDFEKYESGQATLSVRAAGAGRAWLQEAAEAVEQLARERGIAGCASTCRRPYPPCPPTATASCRCSSTCSRMP